MSDLFAEVELPSDSHLQTATKKSAVAQKARGFNPAQALRGISSKTPDNGGAGDHRAPASACTTRGDGRYSNGSNLVQVGNKVHIGPEAFTQGNIEETFRGGWLMSKQPYCTSCAVGSEQYFDLLYSIV